MDYIFSTEGLIGRRYFEGATVQDYISWATHMLENGSDNDDIILLAGFLPTTNFLEADEHFQNAIASLGLSNLDSEKAILKYHMDVVRGVLEDRLNLDEALEILVNTEDQLSDDMFIIDWRSIRSYSTELKEGGYIPPAYPEWWDGKSFEEVMKESCRRFLKEISDCS